MTPAPRRPDHAPSPHRRPRADGGSPGAASRSSVRAWPGWSRRRSCAAPGTNRSCSRGSSASAGRVLTLREPFAPGLWAEAGAMRIPRSHHLTHALIDRFGLATRPFTMDNPEAYCYFAGQRLRHRELADDPRVLGFETTPAECMAPSQLWAAALEPFVRRIADDGDDAWAGDRRRVRPVLRARVPRPLRLVRGRDRDVRPPVQPGSADELVVPRAAARGARRLLHRPRVHRRRHRPAAARVPAGAGARISLRRQDGGDRPVRRRRVRALPQRGRTGSRWKPTTRCSPRRSRCCATSRCSRRSPGAKQRAIRQLHYDASAKVFLQFRRRFWEDDDGIVGGGIGHRPRGAQRLLPRPRSRDRPRRDARQLHVGRGRAAVGFAVARGPDRPGARGRLPHPSAGDRRVRGRARRRCGTTTSSPAARSRCSTPDSRRCSTRPSSQPEGRIHFAGEHASLAHAWIQGAIESGVRAAAEIHERATAT